MDTTVYGIGKKKDERKEAIIVSDYTQTIYSLETVCQ